MKACDLLKLILFLGATLPLCFVSVLPAQSVPCPGSGTFIDSGQLLGNFRSSDVALGDFDADGDLDIVVANGVLNSQMTRIYVNQGGLQGGSPGDYLDSGQTFPANGSYGVAVGDVDGDLDLDFVIANGQTQPNRVFLNDGLGNFSDSGQLLGTSYSNDVALGDLDNDGDLDLVFANWASQPNRVYLNDGLNSGNFIDSLQTLGSSSGSAVAISDLDGDLDLDLVFGNTSNEPGTVWINQGGAQQGTIAEFLLLPPALGSGNTLALALGDLDSDTDIDLLVGEYSGTPNRLYLNDGLGGLIDSGQTVDVPGGGTTGVAFGDIDGDSDLDVAYSSLFANTVWINDGGAQGGTAGQFTNSQQMLGTSISYSLVFGDVDGDSDLDLVVVNFNQPNRIYLNVAAGTDCDQNGIVDSCEIAANPLLDCNLNNSLDECDIIANPGIDCDGNGQIDSCELAQQTCFIDSGQALGNSDSWGVELGDFDSDGDLDAFVANAGQPNSVWVNQGGAQLGQPGDFLDSGQALGNGSSTDIAVGDLDGDGDLDGYVTNINQPTGVWLNQGGGQFFANSQPISYSSWGLDLGDLDGDNIPDAFVVNIGGQPNTVTINLGGAQFVDSNQFLGSSDSRAVSLGDLDSDGDLDAFGANVDGLPQPFLANLVWLNQGGVQQGQSGVFLDSGQTLGNSASHAVELGDLDGDGTLDAFVANNGQNQIWFNQGGAQFSASSQILGSSNSWSVALGDLDGDSDLDAFVGNLSQPNRYWVNQGGDQMGTPGVFVDSNKTLGNGTTRDVALGDLDGDGDLDAFVANTVGSNRVWLNTSPPPDCNQNGIIDSCDIASGFSLDNDLSGIPDECELFALKYISGDGNGDGVVDVGDAIAILAHLFSGGPADCLDANDPNGDGMVDIGDAINLLSYLFNGGQPPIGPFPDCDTDPTPDALDCDSSPACP